MPNKNENPKENTPDPGIEANTTSKTYFSYLQDEVQRLKDEEDRDRWIQELVERNEFLEKEVERLTEQIKTSNPETEQETKK